MVAVGMEVETVGERDGCLVVLAVGIFCGLEGKRLAIGKKGDEEGMAEGAMEDGQLDELTKEGAAVLGSAEGSRGGAEGTPDGLEVTVGTSVETEGPTVGLPEGLRVEEDVGETVNLKLGFLEGAFELTDMGFVEGLFDCPNGP